MACTGWRAAAKELEAVWGDLLEKHHPAAPREEWFLDGDCTRPRVTAKKLRYVIEVFGAEDTARALKYVLTHWRDVRARFSGAPTVPTVGYFRGIAPFFVRHGYTWEDVEAATVALTEFREAHPFESPPDALIERAKLVTNAVAYGPDQLRRSAPRKVPLRSNWAENRKSPDISSGYD